MTEPTAPTVSRLLEGLAELYALAPLDQYPNRVLALVHHVIGCDAASYNEVELSTGNFRALVDPEEQVNRDIALVFGELMHQHPVLAHVGETGDYGAHMISDFLNPNEFHRLALHGEFFGPLGIDDQLSTTLHVDSGDHVIGVALNRSGYFSESERCLLDMLRPHLITAHANAIRYSQAVEAAKLASPAMDRSSSTIAQLTDRQYEVLHRISSGCTNVQVATELDISVGTVKKHVEHILERLEVETRVGAARVFLAAASASTADHWWNVGLLEAAH